MNLNFIHHSVQIHHTLQKLTNRIISLHSQTFTVNPSLSQWQQQQTTTLILSHPTIIRNQPPNPNIYHVSVLKNPLKTARSLIIIYTNRTWKETEKNVQIMFLVDERLYERSRNPPSVLPGRNNFARKNVCENVK